MRTVDKTMRTVVAGKANERESEYRKDIFSGLDME